MTALGSAALCQIVRVTPFGAVPVRGLSDDDCDEVPPPEEHAATAAHVIQTQHRPGEVTLGVMPLFHTMGVRSLLASILVGGTWVPQASFDAGASLELIEHDQVSALYLVPTIYWSLLRTGRLATGRR